MSEVPPGLRPRAVLWLLGRHPWQYVISRWNYKSAIVSSAWRAPMFFLTNLPAGLAAALGAMWAEFLFRFIAAGFYGALTQAFRRVDPPAAATVTVMVLLPLLGHTMEFLVHWARGTPHLGASIAISVMFTALSTTFNLFAMRRGALITGDDSHSLWQDLARMPALMAAFLMSWRSRPFI